MTLSGFHPAIQQWFAGRFTEPTEPQRRAWPLIQDGRDVLIAAPTGSGKTLAAFLSAIDGLLRESLERPLPDEVRVVYVSPLKALSNDVQKNLSEPLAEIRAALPGLGLPEVELRAQLRTGDTPASERQAMVASPPHILVTTPESLYLVLTSARAREMLRSVRTVIVDEIHAVARDKRGSHLALTLERLQALADRPLQRIGLSATQKPIEEIARFLTGVARPAPEIVDAGHARHLDLAIEIPDSPLEAVMAAEVWEEVNARIAQLISEHRTTLVFVNTRRLCERLALHLTERLGADKVTSHHGSMSREKRLEAEQRLKKGELQALVATASLELGIDIGAIDLVIQVGTTRSIATLLQRVGRAGHRLEAIPKGRLFPLSRDEMVECAALLRAVHGGALDRLIIPEKPLDILAQQIVAAAACEEWDEDALFALARRAYPYRDLTRREFDDVVQMLAEGFTSRRGRRGAHLHYDGVNKRIKARRGARLAAIMSGGAIPDLGDFRVVLEPTETFVGTLNEDFAIESVPGEVFQLGNTSYLITKVESRAGVVRVADAKGQPPTLPFWLGEAPGRTDELSAEVAGLRKDVEAHLGDQPSAIGWLAREIPGLPEGAARQMVEYLAASKAILGVLPTQETIILERFFDEGGGMQLVLHAPFGSRINRAWGLALRKRFCRSFNFELQAAATDDAIVISLGAHHSFALEDVFHYLHPDQAEELLVQAMLDAPMFTSRWRWNATRALAILRMRGGVKVPTQIQRMESEDLVAAVFPDQLACPENLVGDREIPEHPLVQQTIRDCLEEAMDFAGLKRVLTAMRAKRFTLVARDTPEPSPLCHEIINARPYAFLDDAPLEERRTRAVITRRGLDVKTAEEFGKLDADAIARVRDEAWPEVRSPDELHDALMVAGSLPAEGLGVGDWGVMFEQLVREGRAAVLETPRVWVAAERLPMVTAAYPDIRWIPPIEAPDRERAKAWTREDALKELVRGRLEIMGPVTVDGLAAALGVSTGDIDVALAGLEREGFVLRGQFSPGEARLEWCERRLLARIHRYTLDRLRREIEPVTAADFMRFLLRWQRVAPNTQAEGPDGLAAALDTLDGYELPAAAWESDVLPARVRGYDPLWLDGLCLSGEIAWGRLGQTRNAEVGTRNRKSGPIRTTPIALFRRERGEVWRALAGIPDGAKLPLSHAAAEVLRVLDERGASFFGDLVNATGILRTEVEKGLAELVAWGLVTADSFAGLRALLVPSERRRPIGGYRRRGRTAPFGVETAGRWSRIHKQSPLSADQQVETLAWQLLRRWGVVFRRLLERENLRAPWRDVLRVLRRLEARGEVRGGRFVGGFTGEQYALPEAIGLLRAARRDGERGDLVAVSGADPLNLVGLIVPGEPVPAFASNRVLYRDGVAVAVREGEGRAVRLLVEATPEETQKLEAALVRKAPAPLVRAYLGKRR